jgi:hypothetical protein
MYFLNKIPRCASRHPMLAFARKNILCGLCKKYLNVSWKTFLEHQKLLLFAQAIKIIFFLDTLYAGIECVEVHPNIFLEFGIFKIYFSSNRYIYTYKPKMGFRRTGHGPYCLEYA